LCSRSSRRVCERLARHVAAGEYATVDLQMKRKAIARARPIDNGTSGLALWRSDASILTWLEAL
jgi:hypothetical protein